jgi:hypothetical protein
MTKEILFKLQNKPCEELENSFASTGADFYDYERELVHCYRDSERDWSGVYSKQITTRFWDDRDQTRRCL